MKYPRKPKPMPKSATWDRVGIPWFEPEDYPRIFEIVNNPGEIPLDFDQWRERAEDIERYWKRKGRLTVRVVVKPDVFIAWCSARSEEPDFDSLRGFVERETRPEVYERLESRKTDDE